MENVIAKILCGGKRHDTSLKHSDTDYLVILNEEIEHKKIFDKVNKIDYLCYGKNFIDKLLRKETTYINLPFILVDLMCQNEYPVDYNLLNDIDYIKEVYRKWLTDSGNAILKCVPRSKRLFYAFVVMYWIKNNSYSLTYTQQEIVNKVHQMEPISDEIIDEFITFFNLDEWYKIEMKDLQNFYKHKLIKKSS